MFLGSKLSGKILIYVYPPIVVLFFILIGSFPNWGKYFLGERQCESVASSWQYLAFIYFVIALLVAGAVVLLAAPKLAYTRGNAETRRIRKEGRSATAVVIAVGESDGSEISKSDDYKDMILTLEVDDGIRPLYLVSVVSTIPYSYTAQYQPGAVLNLMVDKEDPEKVVLVK